MHISNESESYIKNALTIVSNISKQVSFSIIHFCSQHFCDSIKELCQLLNVSRSGYYKWLGRRSKSDKYSELLRHIRKYQAISNYTTGYRKMAIYLRLHKLTSLSVSSLSLDAQIWIAFAVCQNKKGSFDSAGNQCLSEFATERFFRIPAEPEMVY